MTKVVPLKDIYRLFADLLQYPSEDLSGQVERCRTLVSHIDSRSSELLGEFHDFVNNTSLNRLMEIYSSTFDLQVVCYPYVGYQLFGESYKRGAFLVQLKGHYRMHGFSAGNELPDHLPVLLRFLASVQNSESNQRLITLCLIPALEKMENNFSSNKNSYANVISALLTLLQGEYGNMIAKNPMETKGIDTDLKIIAKEEIL